MGGRMGAILSSLRATAAKAVKTLSAKLPFLKRRAGGEGEGREGEGEWIEEEPAPPAAARPAFDIIALLRSRVFIVCASCACALIAGLLALNAVLGRPPTGVEPLGSGLDAALLSTLEFPPCPLPYEEAEPLTPSLALPAEGGLLPPVDAEAARSLAERGRKVVDAYLEEIP